MSDMTVSEMARKGGYARASALSRAERVRIARKAGSAPKRPRSKTGARKDVERAGKLRGDGRHASKPKEI